MRDLTTQGMPSAITAEKSVLSAMMRKPQKFIGKAASEGIDAECFYERRRVHDAITGFFRENPTIEEFDMVGFIMSLQINGTLDGCGGPGEIVEINGYCVDNYGSWSLWGSQLKETKARRMAILAAHRLMEASDSAEAIHETQTTLDALKAAIGGKSRAKDAKEAVIEFLKLWKSDFESSDSIPGMPTGYEEIDEISGGMRPGSLWIVCAKSTRGKTVMMLEIAAFNIAKAKTVAIFSLEMMSAEVTGRLLSVIGNVEYGAITQPKTSNKHHRAAIKRGMDDLNESKVWIDDTPNQTMAHIEAECQRIKDITGELDLIVIDYMQIVKAEHRKGETREQEVARISMAGKQMAKKFGVPVLSASQLNGNGEVRESRSLEQDADTLLFIADDGVKVGKMRNGKRDQILSLYLHGDKQRFLNYPQR